MNDLLQLPFDDGRRENYVDIAWGKWYELLMSVGNAHAPYKTKRMRKHCPWITRDIIALMHTRDLYHRKAMKTDLPLFWNEYRKKRNEVTSRTRRAKQEYIQGVLNQKAGNSNALWSTIKHLSCNTKDSSIKLNVNGTDVVEPVNVAGYLNDYFIDSVSELLHQQPNDNDGVNIIDRNENSTLYERGGAGLASSQSEEYKLPHVTLEYLLQEINKLCVKNPLVLMTSQLR